MEKFLEPESVAVIGASPDPRKGGYALVANLKEKFSTGLYPVHPAAKMVCGVKAVAIWVIGDSACFPILRKHVEAMGAPVFSEISRGSMTLGRVLHTQFPLAS
jgi:hypothetical protein